MNQKNNLLFTQTFHEENVLSLEEFLSGQSSKYSEGEYIKIDLHCHDYNSDVPDELLGRILNVPETWLSTSKLVQTLRDNGTDLITVTNHNNARSCYELQEQGMDVLTGAEFTCLVPDFNVSIHVLAYGFDFHQEKTLDKLRRNLYSFLEYAYIHNIPTIWAHPLYFYSKSGLPPMDFFNKLSVVFQRFEVLNGHRDTWQNILVQSWLQSLTPEILDKYADRYKINPNLYSSQPYEKFFSGGSDSHMGIFSGLTGTRLYIQGLTEKKKTTRLSQLALDAIRDGHMVPYGGHQNSDKLTIAFLDYVFQLALNYKDPGLLRILLHKGESTDKLLALGISNVFSELKRHKVTMNYISLFHESFMGKVPSITKKWFIPKPYKPVFSDTVAIAKNWDKGSKSLLKTFDSSLSSIFSELNKVLFSRLQDKIIASGLLDNPNKLNLNDLINNLEIPSEIRAYLNSKDYDSYNSKFRSTDISKFLDGLSFPVLASLLILAAHYTSARVMYNNRPLLKNFAEGLGKFHHPERMLWLTDTFDDNNGVSLVLKEFHKEIKERNLPVDILVCSNSVTPDEHLLVINPVAEFEFPSYKQQKLRVPDFLQIHKLFLKGEYDRVMSSTEGPMGLAAIYLKNAYSVPAYAYVHTDWIVFAKKVLSFESGNLNRFRRLLRAYYKAYDRLFVLNTDHQKWLTGHSMGFASDSVYLTAHWVDEKFYPRSGSLPPALIGLEDKYVLLYTGRVSKEKGVMELPEILRKIKEKINNVALMILGNGPASDELKSALPDAIFAGWIPHDELPDYYSAADLLLLPSKFDTFSCVLLESFSCGLPAISYKTKGPKDIIQDNENGFLVKTADQMAQRIIDYLSAPGNHESFRRKAISRAAAFKKDNILNQFLTHVGLYDS